MRSGLPHSSVDKLHFCCSDATRPKIEAAIAPALYVRIRAGACGNVRFHFAIHNNVIGARRGRRWLEQSFSCGRRIQIDDGEVR